MLAPRKLSLEEALGRLCDRHSVEYVFASKRPSILEMKIIVFRPPNHYWPVSAKVSAVTWTTADEHDDLFYDAFEIALEAWGKDNPLEKVAE